MPPLPTSTAPGFSGEQLTVNSLVETLGVNVPGIQRVNILVEGQTRDTLAGHAAPERLVRCEDDLSR